jgi:hypothetical protein
MSARASGVGLPLQHPQLQATENGSGVSDVPVPVPVPERVQVGLASTTSTALAASAQVEKCRLIKSVKVRKSAKFHLGGGGSGPGRHCEKCRL